MNLQEAVNDFVVRQLSDYTSQDVRAPKVIHDTILGSNQFKPYEINIIDSPIVQRLRSISQVDVAPLVFPSGNHNRFEHTLGVAVIAQKMMESVIRTDLYKAKKFSENDEWFIAHVKIAAILHDTGHGPFSHLSELVYKECNDYKDLINKVEKLKSPKPHEVLSYLIVTSKAMHDFIIPSFKENYGLDIDLELIGDMIIGHVDDRYKDRAFMIDIINGAFDADKIDYIQRDSHFTGIKLILDLHRLLYTIGILEQGEYNRLCVDMSGVAALEQITFSKMILYSTVYHHQKVRAATSLVKYILSYLKERGNSTLFRKKFDSASDFLTITDHDVYSLGRIDNDGISNTVNAVRNRILPMRTAVISSNTISDKEKFYRITEFLESEQGQTEFKEEIWKESLKTIPEIRQTDIWIDFPRHPNFKEAVRCLIKNYDSQEPITLDKVFPMEAWVKAFSENKYKGYIFTKKEYRKAVYDATNYVIKELFTIDLQDSAKKQCKYN